MFLFNLIQKFKVIKRFNYILIVFLGAGFGAGLKHIGFSRHISPLRKFRAKNAVESELPIKMRLAFERLGPVFVKFGQILSTRSDLLPKNFTEELEKLQAKVPPFGFEDAKRTIEENFQKPLHQIFKKFEAAPFASASLGQVYRAELAGGEKVAVKVQRPKAKEQIKLDTQVLLMLAHLLDKHAPEAKKYNFISIVQEFRRWTLNELDYRKEAANCEIFSSFFKDDEHIYGPRVFWEYSSESVLTLEYIDGQPLKAVVENTAPGKYNKKLIAHRIADSFVKQFFEYGYFHADPHPGNIFILPGNKIMFLDFGMVGFLDDQLTNLGASLFMSLLQKDIENLVALLLKMETFYDENTDRKDVRDVVKVNNLRKELNELVLQWSAAGQAGQFTKLFSELLRTAVRNGINVPTNFTMLGKAVITLDVVVKQLDPEFEMTRWEQPMVEQILSRKLAGKRLKSRAQNIALTMEELLKKLPDSTATIVDNLEKGRFGMEINTDQLLQYEKLLNANSKMNNYSLLLGALLVAAALIYQAKGQPEIFNFSVPQIALYGSLILVVLYFFRKS